MTTMTVNQIKRAIVQGSFSNDELNSIVLSVKSARTGLANVTKNQLYVGAKVSFTSSKTGGRISGVVRKIAVKNVTVDTLQGGWRVPANMLEVE